MALGALPLDALGCCPPPRALQTQGDPSPATAPARRLQSRRVDERLPHPPTADCLPSPTFELPPGDAPRTSSTDLSTQFKFSFLPYAAHATDAPLARPSDLAETSTLLRTPRQSDTTTGATPRRTRALDAGCSCDRAHNPPPIRVLAMPPSRCVPPSTYPPRAQAPTPRAAPALTSPNPRSRRAAAAFRSLSPMCGARISLLSSRARHHASTATASRPPSPCAQPSARPHRLEVSPAPVYYLPQNIEPRRSARPRPPPTPALRLRRAAPIPPTERVTRRLPQRRLLVRWLLDSSTTRAASHSPSHPHHS